MLCGKAITAVSPDLSALSGCDDQEATARGLQYYRSVFADGVPVYEMPIKGKRPVVHPQSDRQLITEYEDAEPERIAAAAKKLGVSVFQLFFAAASMTLGKYTGSEDVVLGIPTNMCPAADIKVTGDMLAYMIYTSGSTGVPKGVMLRHCGISNFCRHHAANILYDTIDKGIDTMLSITTVSFDLTLKDSVGILCSGKTVVFADEEQMNDPRELARLIDANNVDAINATPSRYQQYMLYKPFTEALCRCSLVMAGGERFPDSLMKRLQELGIKNIIKAIPHK